MNSSSAPKFPSLAFCDREPELAKIRTTFPTSPEASRTPTACLLSAEPGFGKTSLGQKVVEDMKSEGYLVLETTAEREGTGEALEGIRRLLEPRSQDELQAFDTRGLLSFTAWLEERIFPREGPRLTDFLEAGLDSSPFTKLLSPLVKSAKKRDPTQVRQFRYNFDHSQALREFFYYLVSSGPLFLFVDDFHWMDRSSLIELERTLFSETPLDHQVGFLLAYRPYECRQNEKAYGLASRLKAAGAPEIELAPLPGDQLGPALQQAAPAMDPQSIQEILREAHGNPLLALEDLALRLSPVGQRETDHPHRDETRSASISAKLEHLCWERQRYLSTKARQCLEVGACIGNTFKSSSILRVLEIAAERFSSGTETGPPSLVDLFKVPDLLDELGQSGFVRAHTSRGEMYFSFTHPLVHEVIYKGISRIRRLMFHSCIATMLEGEDEKGSVSYGELARHHVRAQDYWSAFIAYLKGARDSYRAEIYPHAGEFFTKALDSFTLHRESTDDFPASSQLHQDQVMRTYLLLRIAGSRQRAGEFNEALAACEEAEQLATELDLRVGLAEACYWKGKIQYFIGDDRHAIDNYKRSSKLFRQLGGRAREVRALTGQAASLVQIGRGRDALAILRAALAKAEALDGEQPKVAVETYQHASLVLDASESRSYLKRALKLTSGTNWFRKEGLLLHNLGVEQYYLGELKEAADSFAQARDRLMKSMSFELVYTLNSLGVIKILQRDYGQAERRLAQAEQRIVANFDKIWITNNKAILCHLQGDTERGVELLSELLPTIDHHSDPLIRENSYFNLGVLHYFSGDMVRAEQFVRKSLNRESLYNKQLVYAKRYRELAKILRAQGRDRQADRYRRISEEIFARDYLEKWSFERLTFIFCHLANYH